MKQPIHKTYDAIVVLGGGIRQKDGLFLPTEYEDTDEFGMLGGRIRIDAALVLFERGTSDTIVFSTGVTEKNKAKLGPSIPTEAAIYARYFKDRLKDRPELLAKARIVLEEQSCSTRTNIEEVLKIIGQNNWREVAIVSSRWHLPRTQALCEMLLQDLPKAERPNLTFLSADDTLLELGKDEFAAEVTKAYQSEGCKQRLVHEQNGLNAIKAGSYPKVEFQLTK
jgi:uncharacterized SAM-binding protein YcdF (DUF218 family)